MRSVSSALRVLLRVEPLVRDVERLAGVGRLVREQHRAEGASDLEPVPGLR